MADLMDTHKFFQWIFLSLGKEPRKQKNKKKRFSPKIIIDGI